MALSRQVLGAQRAGEGQEVAGAYLAALTSDTAVVVASCLVPAHDTLLIFVQVARDIPWEGGKEEAGMAYKLGHSPALPF